MVKMMNDMTDSDTMNGEMSPCWSLDGNPDDDNEQSPLAMLCFFLLHFYCNYVPTHKETNSPWHIYLVPKLVKHFILHVNT
jgi:hypothetical protein